MIQYGTTDNSAKSTSKQQKNTNRSYKKIMDRRNQKAQKLLKLHLMARTESPGMKKLLNKSLKFLSWNLFQLHKFQESGLAKQIPKVNYVF